MVRKKEAKIEKKAGVKLQTDIYNPAGKVVDKIVLPAEIFAVTPNSALLAQAVRVYLANQRLGTHSAKTRSEVTGSTRKIYRQKGTGRARHGDIKAPIFIGGGIAFGPKPRDYSLNLSQKMRRKALFMALSDKLHQDKIKIINGLERIQAKTKDMMKILLQLQLIGKKDNKERQVLLILPDSIDNIILAGRNLNYLTIKEANLLNAYTVLTHKKLLFTKEAIAGLADIFLRKSPPSVSPLETGEKKKKHSLKKDTKTVKKKLKTNTVKNSTKTKSR